MQFIELARTFDDEAKKSGYQHAPDDMLKLMFEYVGNIEEKPTGMFKYIVDVQYKASKSRFTWEKDADSTEIEYMLDENTNQPKVFADKFTFYYCSSCNRFYERCLSNHFITKTHLFRCKNKEKKEDMSNVRIENHVKNLLRYTPSMWFSKVLDMKIQEIDETEVFVA